MGLICISIGGIAQIPFSVATNLSGLRSLSPKQNFWAIGQKVQANFHFAPRQTAYASLEYYTEGKFKNNFTAVSRSATASPQKINYIATGRLTYRQLSLGLKHYFSGTFNQPAGISFFGLAGFGFLFARASKSSSIAFDTSLYNSPVTFGQGKIKRLTFDAGVGAEVPLGGNFYAFADVRTWLPASSNPSRYLHNDDRVPLTLIAGAGLRILFGFDY